MIFRCKKCLFKIFTLGLKLSYDSPGWTFGNRNFKVSGTRSSNIHIFGMNFKQKKQCFQIVNKTTKIANKQNN